MKLFYNLLALLSKFFRGAEVLLGWFLLRCRWQRIGWVVINAYFLSRRTGHIHHKTSIKSFDIVLVWIESLFVLIALSNFNSCRQLLFDWTSSRHSLRYRVFVLEFALCLNLRVNIMPLCLHCWGLSFNLRNLIWFHLLLLN